MVRFLTPADKAESDWVLYTGLLLGWKALKGAPFGLSLLLPDGTLSGNGGLAVNTSKNKLTLLHSGKPKLYGVLAVLSAKGLLLISCCMHD